MAQAAARFEKECQDVQARSVASVPTNMPVQASGILALDGIMNPIIRQGLDYWQRLRDDRPYPSREEVHPSDLRTLLRHVVLLSSSTTEPTMSIASSEMRTSNRMASACRAFG